MSPANKRRIERGEVPMGVVDVKIKFTYSGNQHELIAALINMKRLNMPIVDPEEVDDIRIYVNDEYLIIAGG